MDAENISFEALEQRLQHLLRASNGSAVSIEPEDPQIDPSQPQYLCAECTYTTYRLDYFQEHFWRKHVLRRKCLWHGCDNLSSTKEEHEAHVLERHGARCPKDGCNQVFKYKYQTREHLAASHQPVLVLNHVECPWTGCEEKFVDQATLKAHWDCIHTPYTYQAEKDKPFKCPFCHKRYVKQDMFLSSEWYHKMICSCTRYVLTIRDTRLRHRKRERMLTRLLRTDTLLLVSCRPTQTPIATTAGLPKTALTNSSISRLFFEGRGPRQQAMHSPKPPMSSSKQHPMTKAKRQTTTKSTLSRYKMGASTSTTSL